MLLRHGPQGNCPELGDGVYAMYAGRRSATFWVAVGDPTPSRRRLLPLAWGDSPARNLTSAVVAETTEKLRKWREATE